MQGDSGGPLVYDGLLTGVESRGEGCDELGFPAVYTDVVVYLPWIISHIFSTQTSTITNEQTTYISEAETHGKDEVDELHKNSKTGVLLKYGLLLISVMNTFVLQ